MTRLTQLYSTFALFLITSMVCMPGCEQKAPSPGTYEGCELTPDESTASVQPKRASSTTPPKAPVEETVEATDTATAPPVEPPTEPIEKARPPSSASKAGAVMTLETCNTVCAHILSLSLAALPADAPPNLREEHAKALTEGCPKGCMQQGTAAANACIMNARTIAEAVACQS